MNVLLEAWDTKPEAHQEDVPTPGTDTQNVFLCRVVLGGDDEREAVRASDRSTLARVRCVIHPVPMRTPSWWAALPTRARWSMIGGLVLGVPGALLGLLIHGKDGQRLAEPPPQLRYSCLGALALGIPGALAGLILGLIAYPPTAWFAIFEVGLPAAFVGAVIGLLARSQVVIRQGRDK